MQDASLRMKGVVYKECVHSVLTYGAESRGVSEAASHREKNAENDLLGELKIEGPKK